MMGTTLEAEVMKAELGHTVGKVLEAFFAGSWERKLGTRATAASLGWDLGELIDAAEERVGGKWVHFSGLGACDDRHHCDICMEMRICTKESTFDPYRGTPATDPYTALHLDCGHVMI